MTRTRFAPSPTGHLHIGGARTALYCWLHAKKTEGQFLLRIEDTDKERSSQASIDGILESMRWLGLDSDEAIVYQTERFDRYRSVLDQLLEKDLAYRCYCSKQRLDELRALQMANKEKPKYDGHCRDLNNQHPNQPFVIRFKNPTEGTVAFNDLIHGPTLIKNEELDDLIIYRSDDTPTYNFSVVVDDLDMKITHVIRGDDHINNTPRQINLFKALGAVPPCYAHAPMILGHDGARLSKRHGALSVLEYQKEGILPEALLNYLVRLGWSHGDQEIFSIKELIKLFDVADINKSAARFDQDKLLWLNQHYLKTTNDNVLKDHLAPLLKTHGVDIANGPSVEQLLSHLKERSKTLMDIVNVCDCFYQDNIQYDETATQQLTNTHLMTFELTHKKLSELNDWEHTVIYEQLVGVTEALSIKMGKLGQPLRLAMAGKAVSLPLGPMLELIGKERCLARLATAIAYIKNTDTATVGE